MSASRPVLLLVDDEARILSALSRTLRREGYELVTACSAAEALEVLAERSVDAVISDQKMPGSSGLELLRSVAARFPGTVRILLTGWPEEVPPTELRSIGVRALIPKPWDDAELKTTLREQLAAA